MSARRTALTVACLTITLAAGCTPDSTAPDETPDVGAQDAPQHSRTGSFSEWSTPVSLGPTINSSFFDQQAALSPNGLSLYFNSNRPTSADDVVADANIWVATRECPDCPWTVPVLLGDVVNTPGNDANPWVTRDGHRLFFTSNRTGTLGVNDLWVSYREHVHDDFGWGSPENLGPQVNSTLQEVAPSYLEHEDLSGPVLYFNRQSGNQTVPQGDLYSSTMGADGVWSTAQPVTELNSTSADQRAAVHRSGLDIYFWSDRGGTAQIWQSERESVLEAWSPPTLVGGGVNDQPSSMPHIFSHGSEETLLITRTVVDASGMAHFDLFASTRRRIGRFE